VVGEAAIRTEVAAPCCEGLRDRIPLQRRLKAESPAFAQSAEGFGEQFFSDLRRWSPSTSSCYACNGVCARQALARPVSDSSAGHGMRRHVGNRY
jgi:hypothetical protein